MKKKLILSLACVLLLTGCSTTVLDNSAIKEYAYDNFNNSEKMNIKGLKVGADDTLDVSPTYVQVGRSPTTNNYILRYATAVKGQIERAVYTRAANSLSNNAIEKEVEVVYKGIYANDETYYYDGNDLTTDSAYAGNYYWACYLVEFESKNNLDTDFTLSLSIYDKDSESISSTPKSTTLTEMLNNEKELYRLSIEGMKFSDGSNYKYLKAGESIEGLFDIPEVEGYSFNSLCEKGTVSNLVSYNTMPARNVTLVPAYQRAFVESSVSTEAFGKYNLRGFHPTWTKTNLDQSKAAASNKSAFFNEKTGVYEVMMNLTYSEGVSADSLFITYNGDYKSIVANTPVTYTIQNQGTETLNLKLGQTIASGNPDATGNPTATVTLAPGEIKEVNIKTITHQSLMSMFKFLNDVSTPINIGVILENKLTKIDLTKGTFKNGSSSKWVYAYSDLTTELPTLEDGYEPIGYLNEGALNTFNTTVPVDEARVTPVYETAYNVKISETEGGKYSLDSLHGSGRVGFDANELAGNSQTRYTAIYNEELGVYERARLFKKSNSVAVDDSFISYIPGTSADDGWLIQKGKDGLVVTYTFENKGTEAIEFTINQVRSSSSPQGDAQMMSYLQTVALEPGEVKDVDLTLINKDALLTYFKITKATNSDFLLAAILKHAI